MLNSTQPRRDKMQIKVRHPCIYVDIKCGQPHEYVKVRVVVLEPMTPEQIEKKIL